MDEAEESEELEEGLVKTVIFKASVSTHKWKAKNFRRPTMP